jgi:hypothetical protein
MLRISQTEKYSSIRLRDSCRYELFEKFLGERLEKQVCCCCSRVRKKHFVILCIGFGDSSANLNSFFIYVI